MRKVLEYILDPGNLKILNGRQVAVIVVIRKVLYF
jgi:hypothetical protein